MATNEDDGDDLVPAGSARAFVRALRCVEDDGDVEDMAALFGPEAELHRLGGARTRTGSDGARAFWTEYRGQFDEIRSRFTHAATTEGRVVLEWSARARLRGGDASLTYEGASVLDLADPDPGTDASEAGLSGLRVYYDTAALVTGPAGTRRGGEGTTEDGTGPEPREDGPSPARTSDHTARDSGFLDQDTRSGVRLQNES